jgi:hypothetical protein
MNLQKFEGIGLSPFSLLSETIDPPELVSTGILSQRLVFKLEPMLPGTHSVTFRDIRFHSTQKEPRDVQLMSEVFKIDVRMPPPDLTRLEDGTPLMALTPTIPVEINDLNKEILSDQALLERENQRNQRSIREKAFPWIGLAFVLLAGVITLIAKTKPLIPPSLQKPLISMASVQKKALDAIDQLSQTNLVQQEYFDLFFTKLSAIVRTFIEDRYQLRASTYTTQEFLEQVSKHSALEKKAQSLLSQFLISSDHVKFAHYKPSARECSQSLEEARQFIQGG